VSFSLTEGSAMILITAKIKMSTARHKSRLWNMMVGWLCCSTIDNWMKVGNNLWWFLLHFAVVFILSAEKQKKRFVKLFLSLIWIHWCISNVYWLLSPTSESSYIRAEARKKIDFLHIRLLSFSKEGVVDVRRYWSRHY
jgi:hypothetical protein